MRNGARIVKYLAHGFAKTLQFKNNGFLGLVWQDGL